MWRNDCLLVEISRITRGCGTKKEWEHLVKIDRGCDTDSVGMYAVITAKFISQGYYSMYTLEE